MNRGEIMIRQKSVAMGLSGLAVFVGVALAGCNEDGSGLNAEALKIDPNPDPNPGPGNGGGNTVPGPGEVAHFRTRLADGSQLSLQIVQAPPDPTDYFLKIDGIKGEAADRGK